MAIVHDDLVQWGGAERVLLAISEMFPEAPIYTSVYDDKNQDLASRFSERDIRTSFMQKIPGWKSMYKALLPLYPIAFEQFDFNGYDLVISQTTRFAKSIITKPTTKHVCYIHTPPRFLWNFSGEQPNFWWKPYLSGLRIYDQITANRVDQWLAGSVNCQKRLTKTYRVDSKVLYPFVDDIFFKERPTFEGGYYLVVARLNRYKRVDLAVEACQKLKKNLVVVGSGPELSRLAQVGQLAEFHQAVSDEILIGFMRGCRGLIVTAEEDLGLVSLEVQALGKAVIAFRGGGLLETVIEGKTGLFFDEQTIESLSLAIEKFENKTFRVEDCRQNASMFTKKRFQDQLTKYLG